MPTGGWNSNSAGSIDGNRTLAGATLAGTLRVSFGSIRG